jgi:hypothetical protein
MSTSESPVPVQAYFGRPSRLSAVCSQPMQPGQRRLVLDISDTRLIRTNDHACSPPFRFQVTSTASRGALRQAILSCAPRRDTSRWLRYRGGWIEPTRLSRRSAHTRELLWFCNIMKTEPFGKPAVWMYQFWQWWMAAAEIGAFNFAQHVPYRCPTMRHFACGAGNSDDPVPARRRKTRSQLR